MVEDIIIAGGTHYWRAGRPRRIAAFLLELAFFVSLSLAFGRFLGAGFVGIGVILWLIYFCIGSGLEAGRSIGKRIVGIRVIDARHGEPITVVQDFVRHRYLYYYNPIFLALAAFDASRGCFDKPETYVVLARPLSDAELEIHREKPAKLDLEGMRKSLERKKDAQ